MEKVRKFCEVTNCYNEEVAEYYLELSDGYLQRAVTMSVEDRVVPSLEQLTVLEWNIQGLEDECLSERIQAIVGIIKLHQPSVVMLQEVIVESYQLMRSALSPKYVSYTPRIFPIQCEDYFTAIFVSTTKLDPSRVGLIPFPRSTQGRQILTVEAKCKNRDVMLMTSHFESLKEEAEERKNQLLILYDNMKQVRQDCTVIFGGDTNLRDYEFKSFVSSRKFDLNIVNDVWSMLGSPPDLRYSWDLKYNDNIGDIQAQARLRFERLYTLVEHESNKNVFKPRAMYFVGTERLACGMFPSDHWGILAVFSV